MLSRHHFFFVGLVALFGVSFLAPIVVGTRLTGVREHAPPRRVDATFPESRDIDARADGVVIKHSPLLDPTPGEDFLVFGWFKLRVYPKDGQRTVLFSKYDSSARLGAGYALALTGEGGLVRPSVYWRDRAGTGRWLNFAELPRRTLGWSLFALSVHDSRFLGVHGAFLSDEDGRIEVFLLGGYDVSAIGAPSSDDALVFGAGGSRRFSGRLGPLGVFSLPSFEGDFNKLLKSYLRDPLDPFTTFRSSETKLWSVDLVRDQSPHNQEMTTLGAAKEGDGAEELPEPS